MFCHNNSIYRIDTNGREDEVSLMSSMAVASSLGAMNGAAVNGAIAMTKMEFLNSGTWTDVIKSVEEGATIGALMGPLGKIFATVQNEIGLGAGSIGTELASGFSKGIRGIFSMAGGAGINSTLFGDDKSVQALINNPAEQLGIGFAVGMIAGAAKSGINESGAWAGGTSADDIILNFAVDSAGKLGVNAAENIWSTATQVSDQF
jgi:hypothetical protein